MFFRIARVRSTEQSGGYQKIYPKAGKAENPKQACLRECEAGSNPVGYQKIMENKNMRIGSGYDVHRLVEGRKLILGGVEIPFEKGLLGHSDADVLLHAVADALLGAAALGDIGLHFPDTDPAYEGISSLKLLGITGDLLKEKGFRIVNIDATVIAQRPKLRPYIEQMVKNIAEVLQLEVSAVNVKATTEEGLGFTGEGLGIASSAVCLIE